MDDGVDGYGEWWNVGLRKLSANLRVAQATLAGIYDWLFDFGGGITMLHTTRNDEDDGSMHIKNQQTPNLQRGMKQMVARPFSAPNRIRFDRWIFSLMLVMATGSAYSDQQEKVFDVTQLIGTKIPARSASRPGSLPGWNEKGGGVLGSSDLKILMSEYYRGNQAIFIITSIDKQRNQTILDARALPMHIMDYKIVGNNIVFIEGANRYGMAYVCMSKAASASIVIGLAKAEKKFKDCSHITKRVYAAWTVDSQTGKLTSITPKSVTCLMDDFEYSCLSDERRMSWFSER